MPRNREIHASRPARQVLEYLESLGVEVQLGDEDGRYDLEVCCSLFYPNHIISVVEKVLDGKFSRVVKAQHMGWSYFATPVRQMLSGRSPARRVPSPPVHQLTGWHCTVYGIVVTTLLKGDFPIEELNLLLYKIPKLPESREDLFAHIDTCRRSGIPSIRYLHGVAEKTAQERKSRIDDRGGEEDIFDSDDRVDDVKYLESRWLMRNVES